MKGTNVREAIRAWEEEKGVRVADVDKVTLYGRFPPIEKMDQSLNHLGHVKFLSLSTNNISQIANLGGCTSLETLSLGRNQIKNLGGLDPVSDTLENLWISYNNIEKLSGIEKLKKLTHLFMSNNRVSSWAEFERLRELPCLTHLVMVGNPIEQAAGEQWRAEVIRRLPNLKNLDGRAISGEERDRAFGIGPEAGVSSSGGAGPSGSGAGPSGTTS